MASSKFSMLILSLLLLSLVASARSSRFTVKDGGDDSDCDFVGICKTKQDCAEPCSKAGHSPTAVLCVPDPSPIGGSPTGMRCCCITA